jgi:hypothetical protein
MAEVMTNDQKIKTNQQDMLSFSIELEDSKAGSTDMLSFSIELQVSKAGSSHDWRFRVHKNCTFLFPIS